MSSTQCLALCKPPTKQLLRCNANHSNGQAPEEAGCEEDDGQCCGTKDTSASGENGVDGAVGINVMCT